MCSVSNWQSMRADGDYRQVGKRLQEDIQSICNISTALIDAHVDINTGKCSSYEQIRKHIENAEKSLKISENMVKDKLGGLDKSLECLHVEKYRVEQEKENKRMTIENLFKEKAAAEEIFHNSKRALEQAERNLASERQALAKAIINMNSNEEMEDTGIALLAIPIFGWIAGPIMMAEGERLKNEALNTIRAIEEQIRSAVWQVSVYRDKVSDYYSRISEAQREIGKTKDDLNKIQEEIEELMKHLRVITGIQESVRRAVKFVSVLSGRVTVLQKQTKHFILWEPVVNVMKEVMMAAIDIAENQILYSQGLPGLVNTLRENSGRLLAIRNSPEVSEDDSSAYY